ncbi:MAG TPA: RraA family protein [bacterium]|nr:RraA family protein [bacterium]
MTTAPLSDAELQALRAWDTPTICNALEIVTPQRRGYGFTTTPLVCAYPGLQPIVGYARTGTIRAMHPNPKPAAEAKAQRFAYFDYVVGGPGPRIMVLQDLDPSPGFGAYWGEVQTNIHKALGCLGCITNGSVRDLDAAAEGFQMLAGCVGPSHGWVHLVDFGVDVNVAGMTVRSGDLIHADRHGAVVIPAEAAREIPKAVDLLSRREAVIIKTAQSVGFTVDQLKAAIGEAEEIH